MDVLKESTASRLSARYAAESPLGAITLSGFNRNSRGIPRRPFRVLGSYAMVYVIDGTAIYEDARGVTFDLVVGDLLLVFPEIPHTYFVAGEGQWTELYFVFEGPVFDLWRESGLLNPNLPILHLEPLDDWLERFESILGAPHQPGIAPSLLEICRLQMVLSEALVSSRQSSGRQHEDRDWLARACTLLDLGLESEIDLEKVAHSLNMSYDGFRKRFRRLTQLSPAKYRSIRGVEIACELMQRGNLTNRQIAERLGYCDEFYFSRRFKQITGHSPTEWRDRLPQSR
ncbi:MAG TPA: AraC family transcriptional regulator [Thermomicrobiales bacterium]|nr:AraC family transcriptional regulator [Thermomicrobiales bacterium]